MIIILLQNETAGVNLDDLAAPEDELGPPYVLANPSGSTAIYIIVNLTLCYLA